MASHFIGNSTVCSTACSGWRRKNHQWSVLLSLMGWESSGESTSSHAQCMMTSSNGNIFRITGPLCGEFTGPGEFPTQRSVTRSFDVFFDLRLNKRLSKQPWGWWYETPSWSLWRQCNGVIKEAITFLYYCITGPCANRWIPLAKGQSHESVFRSSIFLWANRGDYQIVGYSQQTVLSVEIIMASIFFASVSKLWFVKSGKMGKMLCYYHLMTYLLCYLCLLILESIIVRYQGMRFR